MWAEVVLMREIVGRTDTAEAVRDLPFRKAGQVAAVLRGACVPAMPLKLPLQHCAGPGETGRHPAAMGRVKLRRQLYGHGFHPR